MEQTQAKFEGWAVVEMMGHQREIGFVTTEYFGSAALFRVDTPEIPERDLTTKRPEYLDTDQGYKLCPAGSKVRRPSIPAKTRLVSPGSLYAITPCTEETARQAIDDTIPRRLILLEIPQSETKALTGAIEQPEPEEAEEECCLECGADPDEGHKIGCPQFPEVNQ